MTPSQKRRATLLQRLGSEEAVKQYYRDMQTKSRLTYVENGAKGGFRGVTHKKLLEIASAGGKKSRPPKKRG